MNSTLVMFNFLYCQTQGRLQQQNEQLRQELESSHHRSTQQLQTKVSELETANRELIDKKYKSDSTIRDLKAKLTSLEEVSCWESLRLFTPQQYSQTRESFSLCVKKIHIKKQHFQNHLHLFIREKTKNTVLCMPGQYLVLSPCL